MRKSTWQVADVRRPLVSASHIIQAGNDLFIGKDEAYIINRKKKEKSLQREEESGSRDSILECSLECSICRQRQWLSQSKERRSRHARRTPGEYPSRRDGTPTAYSECGPLPWSPDGSGNARSTSKLEWRDPLRWCPRPRGSADGEQGGGP